MPPNATIADIARQAGVGTATVDRVLNRRPGVNAETVQRVLQVVAELGAPPQRGRPRIGENFRFAFVLPADGDTVQRAGRPADRAGGGRVPPPAHHRGHASLRQRRRGGLRRRVGASRRVRRRGRDGARPAAGQAGDQRAGAHRRACGDAVLRRRRLDARNPHRRRQPRRRPHRRAAARPHGRWPGRAGATRCCSARRPRACRARSSGASASRR